MKCLTCSTSVIVWLLQAATHTAAQTPPPKADHSAGVSGELRSRISKAIRQLGANKYQTRQTAQAELIQIGLPSLDAITAATSDPDAEIRSRCRLILKAIEQIGREKARATLEAKLALLVGDSWKEHRHEFPLWKAYQKLAGTSPAARRIFASMQRADMGLQQTVASDPKGAAAIIQRRFQRIQIDRRLGVRRTLPLGEIAALLMATADPGVIRSGNDATTVSSIYSAVSRSEFAQRTRQQPKRARPAPDSRRLDWAR